MIDDVFGEVFYVGEFSVFGSVFADDYSSTASWSYFVLMQ